MPHPNTKLHERLSNLGFVRRSMVPHVPGIGTSSTIAMIARPDMVIIAPKSVHDQLKRDGCQATVYTHLKILANSSWILNDVNLVLHMWATSNMSVLYVRRPKDG